MILPGDCSLLFLCQFMMYVQILKFGYIVVLP